MRLTLTLGGSSSSSSVVSATGELHVARRQKGREVEYSFPHRYHDKLEGVLMWD